MSINIIVFMWKILSLLTINNSMFIKFENIQVHGIFLV
jgi:hypothetical protein